MATQVKVMGTGQYDYVIIAGDVLCSNTYLGKVGRHDTLIGR